MWGNQNPWITSEAWNAAAALENNLAIPPMVKHRTAVWLSNSPPGCTPQRNEHVCPCNNRATTETESLQQRCSQQPKGRNDPNVYHLIIADWATKRKEILIHVMMWKNLENIMLRKRSRSRKTTYCVILLIGNPQNREIYKYTRGCLGLMAGMEVAKRVDSSRRWSFFVRWWECSKTDYGDVCTYPWIF